MKYDTHPGSTPIPVEHKVPNCPCGHEDDLHEEVDAGARPLVICIECDAEEDEDELPI